MSPRQMAVVTVAAVVLILVLALVLGIDLNDQASLPNGG